MKQTAHHKRKHIMLWVGLALLFLGFTGWVLWGNSALTVTEFQLEILPEEGSYVIAQVSDFHNAEFGKDNCRLVALLKSGKVDIAFANLPIDDSALDIRSCFAIKDVFVAAANYPCDFEHLYTPAELARFPIILLEKKGWLFFCVE